MSKFKWFTVKFNFDTSSASNDCITQSLIGNAFCLDVKLTFRQLYLSTACFQLDLKKSSDQCKSESTSQIKSIFGQENQFYLTIKPLGCLRNSVIPSDYHRFEYRESVLHMNKSLFVFFSGSPGTSATKIFTSTSMFQCSTFLWHPRNLVTSE